MGWGVSVNYKMCAHSCEVQLNLLRSQTLQVHLLLIWTTSQRGSEGREGGPVSEQGPLPTYRERALHNKSTEPSLGMLVLINDIKVKGHQTASGAHTSNTCMCSN